MKKIGGGSGNLESLVKELAAPYIFTSSILTHC
jgi:hypothetical protein